MWSDSSRAPNDEPTPTFDTSALGESAKSIAGFLEASTIGLCILDTEFRYLSINEALAAMNGLSPTEHLGKTVREVLGPLADEIEPHLRLVVASGAPTQTFEISAVLPGRDVQTHWADYCFPIRDASGKVTRIGAVIIEKPKEHKQHTGEGVSDPKLKREIDWLQTLLDITNLLSSNWDVPVVFPMISARIRRVLRQEFASFAVRDDNSGKLIRQAIDFPLGKGLFSAAHLGESGGPAHQSVEHGEPMIFSRHDLQSNPGDSAQSLVAEGLQSLCCLPLTRPRGTMGVFVLGSTRKDAFHSDDMRLLTQIATQLALAIENQRAAGEIELLKQRLGEEQKFLAAEPRTRETLEEIVGSSTALKSVLEQAITVATSNATVLILGETGTGKELVARAIHRMSRRKNGPFVKVNCAAIPTGLLESELFGHEKGAFTGAVSQKVGRMEIANGGTLFLDEIGEIPLELQPKLLRVLQDHEFERLGANHTIKVNLRILAATNRDLAESVEDHQFRSDLFYRLSVFPIAIPPLRERQEDIPALVRYFVHKHALRMDRYIETIPKETMEELKKWPWPGNVRELENLMERSVILSEGHVLRVPLSELRGRNLPAEAKETTDHSLDGVERQHIIRVLRETGGLVSGAGGAARRLGIPRSTLQSKMRRLKITRDDYIDPKRR